MPACATQKTIVDQPSIRNLFLPVPDTDFRDFLDEVAELLRLAPEIIAAIEGDPDAHARQKKRLRLEAHWGQAHWGRTICVGIARGGG